MKEQVFKQLGFLEAEIKVYQALLKLGPSMVSDIHKEIGLHRTHIYDLIEKLKEKGLVSMFIQSGKKHFKAAPPSKIMSYINDKKEAVRSILPSFEELMKTQKESTSVEVFKGKEGLKTILQDIIKTKKDYCVMGNINQFEEILEFAMPNFLRKVEKLKIKERIVSEKKEKYIKIKTGSYKYLSGDYPHPTSFVVYGNKVVLFVWHLPYFAILIENNDVAKTYQGYFNFFWKVAKKN